MVYNVLQYLEKNAEKFPDKIALEDDISKLTYAEYKEKAMQIGSYIIKERFDYGRGGKFCSTGSGFNRSQY